MTTKVLNLSRFSFPFFGVGALGLLAVAGAMLAGSALGYYSAGKPWATWLAGTSTSTSTSTTTSSTALSDTELIAKFRALDWSTLNGTVDPRLGEALALRPAFMSEVVRLYRSEQDPRAKREMANFLSSVPPEVGTQLRAQALLWASGTDTAGRYDGLLLLSQMPPHSKSIELALVALAEPALQTEPRLLNAAIRCLQRSDVPPPPLVRQVVARLSVLTHHSDEQVRAHAVQGLGDWDRRLAEFPLAVDRLLGDVSPDVRMAAIGATSIAGLSTAAVKDKLLRLYTDPATPLQVRDVARMNLDRFDFTEQEYRTLVQANEALERDAAKLQGK